MQLVAYRARGLGADDRARSGNGRQHRHTDVGFNDVRSDSGIIVARTNLSDGYVISEAARTAAEAKVRVEHVERPVKWERGFEAETGAEKIDRDQIRPAE